MRNCPILFYLENSHLFQQTLKYPVQIRRMNGAVLNFALLYNFKILVAKIKHFCINPGIFLISLKIMRNFNEPSNSLSHQKIGLLE